MSVRLIGDRRWVRRGRQRPKMMSGGVGRREIVADVCGEQWWRAVANFFFDNSLDPQLSLTLSFPVE